MYQTPNGYFKPFSLASLLFSLELLRQDSRNEYLKYVKNARKEPTRY